MKFINFLTCSNFFFLLSYGVPTGNITDLSQESEQYFSKYDNWNSSHSEPASIEDGTPEGETSRDNKSLSGVYESPTGNKPLPPPPENRTRTMLIQNDITHGVRREACTTSIRDSPNYLTRNGRREKRYRWPQFFVAISDEYNAEERELIMAAMSRLHGEAVPCIDFLIWPEGSDPTGDYVYIENGDGCHSAVGRQGGRQNMSLAKPGCMTIRVIMHEMIHALGFGHEHQRSDRDDYIDIHWDNIEPEYAYAFDKLPGSRWTTYGVPYNTKSIMHYYSRTFGKDDEITMTKKDGGFIDWNEELADTDIEKLMIMYDCY